MLQTFLPIFFIAFYCSGYPAESSYIIDKNLAEILDKTKDDREHRVIVLLHDEPDFSIAQIKNLPRTLQIKKLHENSRRSLEKLYYFFKANPVKNLSPFWHINGLSITAETTTIKKLSNHPVVSFIRADSTFSMPETAYSISSTPSWNIHQIKADILWSFGFTGSQSVVGVMDTGADVNNPHLQPSFRGGSNSWFDVNGEYTTPHDNPTGHGTQVLGIIAGSNDIDIEIGVAPSAKWIAAKIFDDNGQTTESKIHSAFQWMLDPDGDPNTDDAPNIVNCSWGLRENVNQCIVQFQPDVIALKQAGIAVVFAAGNENVDSNFPSSVSPANYSDSLSVGAIDESYLIDDSSSRGPSACDGSVFPKLAAPGVSIETCDLSFGGLFDEHVFVDGTSFAAPHVSAAFALLNGAFPDANNLDIESALIAAAADLGMAGPDNVYGNGLIDLYGAYQLLALNYCPADFDHNHLVNYADLKILTDDWLNPDCLPQYPCKADLNNDYKVNFFDFAAFAQMFLDDECL